MSLGGSQSMHTEEPRILSLRVNQSAYGGGKARIWGKCRVSSNMLWYGDFRAIPHTESTSAGKGGGGMESSNTSYTYTASFVLGLGSGVVSEIGKVWNNKDVTTLVELGLSLKTGALRQAPWTHLTSNYPAEAVGYSHIAYVACAAFDLGGSAVQPNLSFEVFGERLIADADDALPADIVTDMVTDPLEGIGLPAGVLANLDDYALWCNALGITLSLAATAQRACREYLADILKATLAEAVWSNGQIKLVPYGDTPVGAWSPDVESKFTMTEHDLLEQPIPKRTQPADAVNKVTLNWINRAKDYNDDTLTRDDISAVTDYGPIAETIDLPCISRAEVAELVCEFWRDRNLYIRNTWEIEVDERFCLVEPMDLGSITFSLQYLDVTPVRVVETTDHGNGRITMLVEEWPFGLLKTTAVPGQSAGGFTPERNIAPGATSTPVIFEAPNHMTAPNLEIWIAASGGPHWGAANVWVSDDGSSYQQVGTLTNPARYGSLDNALANGDDPDETHTLTVDLSISSGKLMSATQADADNGNTLCWVDGEMVSYATAELTAANRYALTYLRRGMQGTVPALHATGSKFVRIDDAVFRYRVPRERIGSPVWVKLQSVNLFGRSPEPLDTVTPYQYTIVGNRPAPLGSLSATGDLFAVALAWTMPAATGIDGVELWASNTNDRAEAYNLTFQRRGVTRWMHSGLNPGQLRYYWGRTVDTSGNTSEWVPTSATGGVFGTPSADPDALLAQIQASLGMPELAAELAAPISSIFGANSSAGLASLQEALDNYDIVERMRFQEAVTNATVTVNPETGEVQLLATASVTTDVEQRLTAVETDLNAADGTLTSTVAQVATIAGDVVSAQSQIALLQNQVTLSASQVFVNDAVQQATGSLTVAAANAYTDLAEQAIQSALGQWDADQEAVILSANVAVAQDTLSAQATALEAEVSARQLLVASVATNAAAITTEQLARATADSALSQQITNLAATAASNTAAISTEQTARANAVSAVSTQVATLSASVGDSIAGVETDISTVAGQVEAVEAKWSVKVQTVADGRRVVAGLSLLSNTLSESVFAVLADKLLVYRPNGSGAPIQIITLGQINGQTVLGLSGSLILDGSIVADALAANTITAGSGVIADAAIATAKIVDAAITTAKIGNLAVTTAKIKDAAITSAKIKNAEIDTLHLAGNAVTIPLSAQGESEATTSSYVFDGNTPVVITATGIAYSYSDGFNLRVKRNGVVISTSAEVGRGAQAYVGCSITVIDLPPAGTSYYTAQVIGAEDNGSVGLAVIGTKR